MPHFRNVETGEVRLVDDLSAERRQLLGERTRDGFPRWEQTGAHDADPEHFASADEVEAREGWGIQPLSSVTGDGVGQSARATAELQRRAADLTA